MSQAPKANIVDLLLLDHSYLKECIKVLKDEEEDKMEKLSYARSFLDCLKKHAESEEKTVYNTLREIDDMRFTILEGEVEHGIADAKIRLLSTTLQHARTLSEDTEVELKVLAEFIEHHLKEEEKELFPKMRKELDKNLLHELGFQYLKVRNFTTKDLEDYPKLQEMVLELGKGEHRLSPNLADKVEKYLDQKA